MMYVRQGAFLNRDLADRRFRSLDERLALMQAVYGPNEREERVTLIAFWAIAIAFALAASIVGAAGLHLLAVDAPVVALAATTADIVVYLMVAAAVVQFVLWWRLRGARRAVDRILDEPQPRSDAATAESAMHVVDGFIDGLLENDKRREAKRTALMLAIVGLSCVLEAEKFFHILPHGTWGMAFSLVAVAFTARQTRIDARKRRYETTRRETAIAYDEARRRER